MKSDTYRYYIKAGTVMYMVKADGVRYRAYEVSDEGKLVLAKNVWLPTYNNLVIPTDATGLSDIIYYRK